MRFERTVLWLMVWYVTLLTIDGVWKLLELMEFGRVTPSVSDSIFGAVLAGYMVRTHVRIERRRL